MGFTKKRRVYKLAFPQPVMLLLPLPRPQRSIGKAIIAVKQHFPKIPFSCKASMLGTL